MRERDPISRVDVNYPFDKMDQTGQVIEHITKPPMFDVKFIYHKPKKSTSFKIIA